MFFGGVQAISRDPASGALNGAGDPRRGGVAVLGMKRSSAACATLAVGCLAIAAAAAIAGCGTASPDLFVVQRDGAVPGARLHMLISDTTVRCNRGEPVPLTSAQTIEARDILDDLLLVQSGEVAYPKPPRAQIFHFAIRTQEGALRFPDTAQRPQILPRTQRFVRRVAIDTCKLTR